MICIAQAKKYCRDAISMIENYDKAINDQTETWICHHRLGLTHSHKELERLGLYENRPAEELIFLTHSEHSRLHNMNRSAETKQKIAEANKGQTRSEETKRKLSDAMKGEKNPMYGKTKSEQTKRKMSESHKARWARRKANA